jgi:hypothetical protein
MNRLLQLLLALVAASSLAFVALAQTPTQPTPVPQAGGKTAQAPKLRHFPTAEAADAAITEALRKDDDKAIADMLGSSWRDFVPGTQEDEDKARETYLKAYDENHKLVPAGDDKMLVEVGTTGFKMPIPIVKDADGWRFDIEAGHKEMIARQIGANELYVIQTLMAIVDAQFDYAALQTDKTGSASYARRLLSSPGKQDGLYWEAKPGEPDSPLGPLVAKAQPGDREGEGYHGYHYRLLYGQGPDAPGGAYSYLVNGRMIGGFGVIAWPVKYGETGVMTFIVNQTGDVYENDFGPDTAQDVGQISLYNPDKDWEKSDTVPP